MTSNAMVDNGSVILPRLRMSDTCLAYIHGDKNKTEKINKKQQTHKDVQMYLLDAQRRKVPIDHDARHHGKMLCYEFHQRGFFRTEAVAQDAKPYSPSFRITSSV